VENVSDAVVFDEEFRFAPIRWIVRAHIALILTTTVCRLCFPSVSAAEIASLAVVIAQWGLLLIWLTLIPERSLRRMFAVAAYADLAFLVHMLPGLGPWEILSHLAGVFGYMISGHFLSLPLLSDQAVGLRVKRVVSGRVPSAAPLQFPMSRLLWMTALAAVLFGAVQAGSRGAERPEVANAIAVWVVFGIGAAIVLSWIRVCVWIALTPGRVLPRFAVAAYLWLLGGLLLVRDPSMYSWDLFMMTAIPAIATAILLATLVLVRRQGYYAIWEKEEMHDNGHEKASDVIAEIGGTNAGGHR
jgi:hypothetical protein